MSREAMQQALDALELAGNSHGIMLLSDPPQDAWKTRRVNESITAAISALRTALAEQPAAPVVLTDKEIIAIRTKKQTVQTHPWADSIAFARAILADAIPPGCVVVPVEPSEEQVDATRQILLYYDTQGRTYEGLRQFLDHAGVDYKSWCHEWFKTLTGHMTKGGTAILVYAAMIAARPGEKHE